MAVMLYGAVRVPRMRATMVLFATAPGFQLAWTGVVNRKGPLLIIPVLVVPLAVAAWAVLAAIHRHREETAARPTRAGDTTT